MFSQEKMKKISEGKFLTEVVRSLPRDWYYSVDQYEKELQNIFYKDWIYVCGASALEDPLSYKTVKIGNQSVIILRDKTTNELKAYLNTCRHRGSILCSKSEGKLKTNVLSCPYHNWVYSCSTGELKKTSSTKLPPDFKKIDYGLYTVQLKNYRGLIFLCLDKDKVWDIDETIQYYEKDLDKFPLENLKLGHIWKKEVQANWKMYWENYSECLHCPEVHPELTKLVPTFGRRMLSFEDHPDWKSHLKINKSKYKRGLKDGAETWSLDGSAQGQSIIQSKDFSTTGRASCTSWPSMFLGAFIDHVRIVRLLPIDQVHTEVFVEWFFDKSTLENKTYKKENVVDFGMLVVQQDGDICEVNQQGIYNKGINDAGVLMPEEYTIKEFQDWLKQKVK